MNVKDMPIKASKGWCRCFGLKIIPYHHQMLCIFLVLPSPLFLSLSSSFIIIVTVAISIRPRSPGNLNQFCVNFGLALIWIYIFISVSVYKSLLNLCKYVVEMHQHVHSPKDSCGLAAIWSKKTTFWMKASSQKHSTEVKTKFWEWIWQMQIPNITLYKIQQPLT